jgi:hypothetical protein
VELAINTMLMPIHRRIKATMMVKPREIFGKFEYLCKARYNPLVVHDFDHFMRKQAIWQRKHPELMCFLCEDPQ